MKPLRIDFAPRTRTALLYRVPLWLWPLLSFALMLVLGALWQLGTLHQHTEQAQADLADTREHLSQRAGQPRRTAARSAQALVLPPEQVSAINAAVRQLNLPWDELLETLEAAAHPRVALLELHPEAATRRLQGVAEAKSADDMIAYIERLKAQELLDGVLLSSHQVNEQDRNKPVRFEFSITWKDVEP